MLDREGIDTAKGLGIIFVLLGHMSGVGGIFYIFHMPLFFFLSGMSLKPHRALGDALRRDARNLLLFGLLGLAVCASISPLFRLGGVDVPSSSALDWRTYLLFPFTYNGHNVTIFLIAWFIIALFLTRLLSAVIIRQIDTSETVDRPQTISLEANLLIALSCGWLGMVMFAGLYAKYKLWELNLASQVAVGTMFCIMGYVTRALPRLPVNVGLLFVAAACFVAARGCGSGLIMSWSKYPLGFVAHTAGASFGIMAVIMIAPLMSGSFLLQRLGRESKWIMGGHLTVYALINLYHVQMGGFGASTPGAFTVHNAPSEWPIYLALGLLLPMGAHSLFRNAYARWPPMPDVVAGCVGHFRRGNHRYACGADIEIDRDAEPAARRTAA
jgi:fucose 4-O-acetylase-like acetyltransferase